MDNEKYEESARVKAFWLRMRTLNRFVTRRLRQGWGPRRSVLLLTTTGRRSGLPRVTPLQFEAQDGLYFVASGRGLHADWVRNLAADPAVLVEVKGNQFVAIAELVTDPQQIARFLALRLRRHPILVRAIMTAEGLPLRYSPQDLIDFADQKALVVLRPEAIETTGARPARRRRIGPVTIALGVLATLIAAGFVHRLLVRPWYLRWGATAAEATDSLPGDSIVAGANMASTRAITVAAPPKQVWAWLVQIGQGRGGFYSYDHLENLAGLHIHSTDELNPKFLQLAPGDVIAVEPGGSGFAVDTVVHERLLLLHVDGSGPGEMGAHFRTADAASTWVFVLRPQPDAATRLVVRWRARYPGARSTSRVAALIRLLLEPLEFVMERKMLLGIRQRAEQTYNQGRK